MKNYIKIIIFTVGIITVMLFVEDEWHIGNWVLSSFSVLFSLSAFFISIVIFFENRNPAKTLTWLIVLAVFPVVGFFFYLLFGRNFRKKRLFRKKGMIDEEAFSMIVGDKKITDEKVKGLDDVEKKVIHLANNLSKSPVTFNTYTSVLTNGKETYEEIFEAIRIAKDHIHLEYYIVRDDEVGIRLKEALILKAREGVKVRFLYDAVGSWKLSQSYLNELVANGVEMVAFSPVKLPIITHKANFRNHRKIIVIDGYIGFVGGLNIGKEYLGKDANFGFWRDTHLLLKGEGVRTLQIIFLQDWYYMTGHMNLTERYIKGNNTEKGSENDQQIGGVQLIAGGPDSEWDTIKDLFFAMIVSARKSISICTPYFIPDDDIFSALKIAALSGIRVNVIVPARPDKRTVFYASRSYFPELLEAGVNIYEYNKGFLHSKIIIVDDQLASIGTANMDMRSFHLNFEVNAFLYKTESIETLVKDFKNDLTNSQKLELDKFSYRPYWMRLIESLARLLSPLL
ncbi:cardiolipin synthase [Lottiidibacillus patelloidae]|uniref:Cardiolipin synthase n=1 Tax=Lottiidibacillus patelloidae TaxID=2670334 RepID=A0A263BX75_9BACI|nr:cardiolipin synthase [Lottiidibacillus patelloidae]OZM58270.1 cardiolipin synthase [Lottiidibacillus patelloidae]